MGIEAIMAQLGAVPRGFPAKWINEEGQATYAPQEKFNQSFWDDLMGQGQKAQQKKNADFQRQVEMYSTLRKAGYSPSEAHKAVKAGVLSETAGQETDLDTLKTRAEIDKINAEKDAITKKTPPLRERILNKIANGEPLTVGEQRVYDDILKKQSGAEEDMVAVEDPNGNPGRIPKSYLEQALAAGYKQR